MTGVSGSAACAGAVAPWRDDVLPGPDVAGSLAALDVTRLADSELLDAAAGWERVASWVAAQQAVVLAELARRPSRVEMAGDDPAALRSTYAPPGSWVREFAEDEVAARLRVSRAAASSRVAFGCALAELPVTRGALSQGRYDVARARVVVEEVAVLDRTTAREVEAAVVERGVREPAARLRARCRRAVLAVDPAAAHERAVRAREARSVGVCPRGDGMAGLFAHLTAVDAVTVDTVVTAAAKAVRASLQPGDPTTLEQLRADVFVAPFAKALATGVLDGVSLDGSDAITLEQHRGERAALQVTVAASTLLGHDDAPAMLAGYGPVTAPVARALAPDARWRRLLTDPRSGTVLDVGTTTYRPPAPLQRHVEARDVTCRFPGCARRTQACDLDHVIPFPDGPTSAGNLGAVCRRHHRLKHSGVVELRREPDGTAVWVMPTGHVHRVDPAEVGPIVEEPDVEAPATDRAEVGPIVEERDVEAPATDRADAGPDGREGGPSP